MKENSFCTIITGNYLHYAVALHDSLLEHNKDINFSVLITTPITDNDLFARFKNRNDVDLYYVEDFKDSLSVEIKDKYHQNYHDAYRWNMKPMLIIKLLAKGFNKVIYIDSDVFFFNDYNFLFTQLEDCKVLLSPHWRSSDPLIDETNFRLNFLDGIFNGGFIGASTDSEPILKYWAKLCLFNCEVNRKDGYYVDQRYLDILPTRFKGVDHINHKGCNVANWNMQDCKRVLKNNTVFINGTDPIIFIHFTNSMFKGVYVNKKDHVLKPYVEAYSKAVEKYYKKSIIEEFFNKGIAMQSRSEAKGKANKSVLHKLLKRIKR